MDRMSAAGRAELLDRELVGLLLLIFGGGVVPALATVTRHPDQVSHCDIPKLRRFALLI